MNKIFITLYLFLASVFDIKSRKIPLLLITIFSIFEMIISLFSDKNLYFLFGLIPGVIMIVVSYITNNSLGYGDAFLIFSLGFTLSFYEIFHILLSGLFFTSIIGCLLLLKKKSKKYKLPFSPFLLLAWLTLL